VALAGRLPGVLQDRLPGREGDRTGLTPTRPQALFQEVADLAEAASDAGRPLDSMTAWACLAGRAGFLARNSSSDPRCLARADRG
jgi:hypothetical protein